MKDILPVGTVVLLKGATKKTVIMGILQVNEEEENKLYEYLGVPYPEGYMGRGTTYLFNREDINDIVFTGYDNPERQGFLELVEQIYEEARQKIEQEEK